MNHLLTSEDPGFMGFLPPRVMRISPLVTAYSYVRMSTGPQLRGDSLRRQVERSEAFAAEHGLTLDTTLRLADLGVSAYDGSNLRGQPRVFRDAVTGGRS